MKEEIATYKPGYDECIVHVWNCFLPRVVVLDVPFYFLVSNLQLEVITAA